MKIHPLVPILLEDTETETNVEFDEIIQKLSLIPIPREEDTTKNVKLDDTKENIKLDDTIQEISTAAFSGNKMLMEVTLPRMLRVIGAEVFLNCSLLSKVKIPMTCKEIGMRAFLGCCSLQDVTLPTDLTCIQEETFSRCSKLKTMVVPWAVVVIEHGAFSHCKALLSVELPKGLKKIESRAFAHCEQLKNIEVPKSVNVLGDNAFARCERGMEVRFGVNIESMERRFDDLPLHKVCYYQAHYTLPANLKKLEKALHGPAGGKKSRRTGGIFSLCRKADVIPAYGFDLDAKDLRFGGYSADSFGMSPLHVLVLSGRPCLAICETLLAYYPDNVTWQDQYGNTPIDYACMVGSPIPIMEALLTTLKQQLNIFPEDEGQHLKYGISLANQYDSMNLLVYFTYKYFNARIEQLGLDEWKQDVVNQIEIIKTLPHAMLREEQLERISICLCQYEQKETWSLVELALWKARMQSEQTDRLFPGPSWRRTCQIRCGAEIVIPLLMSNLNDGERNHCH
mmetsp:Transcript_33341/g.80624  ORF Transcript_33341/g.80624 Transcript_33341/m.80624 type:complete len:511 (+) Transcript_33341:488-2020(+)|eukprot:CAMPEP_0113630110 /NCGR_PEP_ID=MMETSP0017_2-20120614/15640_1 /TAXON_ID=2856 /ORGANISM="Cylindrotheca closterium" /LENGTH=510 /DNA_ID=CAMNT_0000540553 /DNA_START=468 /DNA_END=2000 /DNA_ORIENTATION=- /assembly_acc=CAM_ASM_000147